MVLLHERWFVDSTPFPMQWDAVTRPGALVAVAAAGAVAAGAAFFWRATGRKPIIPGPFALGADERSLAILYGAIPLMLAVHLAVPLVVSGINVELFVPNLVMREPGAVPVQSPFAAAGAVLEIGIGLALVYGAFTRLAAAGLVLLWLAGAVAFGPVRLLEHAIIPGTALTLWITARGPFAVDALLSSRLGRPRLGLVDRAMTPLRIGTGISLVTLAVSEKLWNLPLGLAFLERYPVNFLPALGLPVGNETFLLMAGTVELLAGLLLLTNVYSRAGIVLLWLPFNLTLAVFGWRELVGHLPIYGAMAALAVWGSGNAADARALRLGLLQRPVLFDPPEGVNGGATR